MITDWRFFRVSFLCSSHVTRSLWSKGTEWHIFNCTTPDETTSCAAVINSPPWIEALNWTVNLTHVSYIPALTEAPANDWFLKTKYYFLPVFGKLKKKNHCLNCLTISNKMFVVLTSCLPIFKKTFSSCKEEPLELKDSCKEYSYQGNSQTYVRYFLLCVRKSVIHNCCNVGKHQTIQDWPTLVYNMSPFVKLILP